jgi:hypothetical protein
VATNGKVCGGVGFGRCVAGVCRCCNGVAGVSCSTTQRPLEQCEYEMTRVGNADEAFYTRLAQQAGCARSIISQIFQLPSYYCPRRDDDDDEEDDDDHYRLRIKFNTLGCSQFLNNLNGGLINGAKSLITVEDGRSTQNGQTQVVVYNKGSADMSDNTKIAIGTGVGVSMLILGAVVFGIYKYNRSKLGDKAVEMTTAAKTPEVPPMV